MMKSLHIIPDKCTGCMQCELACSWVQTGSFQPSRSVVRVNIFDEEAAYAPYTCLQCDEAWCMNACPVNAIAIDPTTGAKVVLGDVCVGCHRSYPFPQAHLDLDGGGLACAACAREASAALPISAAAVGALDRLRTLSWDEALATPLPGLEPELASVLDAHVSRLIGQPTRTRTFLRELQRLTPGGRP